MFLLCLLIRTWARTHVSASHLVAHTNYALIAGSRWSKFWKFSWMQDSCENLEAVDNTRARTREVRACVYDINVAVDRGWKRVEIWKVPKQLVIMLATIDVIATKSEYDNFGARTNDLRPIDFCRRPMFAA